MMKKIIKVDKDYWSKQSRTAIPIFYPNYEEIYYISNDKKKK